MKTKLLPLLFAIVASIGTIFANGTEIDGICYYLNNSDMSAAVTYNGNNYNSYNYYSGNIVIPSSVTYEGETYDVTSISAWAFCNSRITSITIPESIRSFGGYVFKGCSNLTSVVWNAKNCGDFQNYDNLPFAYSGGVTEYRYDIRSQITSFIFGENVEHIPAYLCYVLRNLTSVTIPNSVTSIGYRAFSNCGLTSLTIPNRITSIESQTFTDCTNLTSVAIGNSVTSIGEAAFQDCSSLTRVEMPNSIISIGRIAFRYCNNLKNITISNSVTIIGEGAFDGCDGASVYLESATPAIIESNTFSSSAIFYVPNCAYTTFSSAPIWKDLTIVPVDVNLAVMNNTGGVVVENCGQMEIEAIPYIGYQFKRWQDGNKENPRKYTLTQTNRNFIAEFEVAKYQITLSCDANQGSITGDQGKFVYESEHTIEAVAKYGYHFTQWSDGETENPRTFVLEQDTTFTAEFAKNTYSIETHANAEQGSVTGLSEGEYLDEISLTAVPVDGYRFSQWQDGNTDNPRYFILTHDTVFTAEFVLDVNFNCGNDWLLTWDYNADTKTLTISGEGAFNENMECSTQARAEMENLVFAEGVTSIGANAFANCVTLQTLELSSTVKKINENAFYNCESLTAIYNHRTTPTNTLSSAFDGVDKFECVLYVPAASVSMYRNAAVWSEFYNIRAIQSTPTVIDVVGTNGNTDGYLKFIRNGQLLILRDGKTYTVQGQEVR